MKTEKKESFTSIDISGSSIFVIVIVVVVVQYVVYDLYVNLMPQTLSMKSMHMHTNTERRSEREAVMQQKVFRVWCS